MIASGSAVSSCPANGDLHNVTALHEMIEARASPETRELVILILGWTNGKAQVNMRDSGTDFVSATLSSLLNQHSITNYLVLTPHLINQPNRAAGTDNLCRAVLRPRGICCGYSSVGMREAVNNSWEIFPTHPYVLFLQRWWFTAQALVRGVSVLSIDSDLRLSANPLSILRRPPYDNLDVIFQGDGGHPVRMRPGTTRLMTHLSNHRFSYGDEVGVECSKGWLSGGDTAALASRSTDPLMRCVCGVTAAPAINTGFVYARARRGASRRARSRRAS